MVDVQGDSKASLRTSVPTLCLRRPGFLLPLCGNGVNCSNIISTAIPPIFPLRECTMLLYTVHLVNYNVGLLWSYSYAMIIVATAVFHQWEEYKDLPEAG